MPNRLRPYLSFSASGSFDKSNAARASDEEISV